MVLMKKRSKTQPCFFIVFAYAIPGTVVFAANRTFLRYLALRTTTNIHPRRDELLLDRQLLAVHLLILPSYLHNLLAPISRLSVRSPRCCQGIKARSRYPAYYNRVQLLGDPRHESNTHHHTFLLQSYRVSPGQARGCSKCHGNCRARCYKCFQNFCYTREKGR
jgi:hypothetical protein